MNYQVTWIIICFICQSIWIFISNYNDRYIISGNKWIISLQTQSITIVNSVHRNPEKHF